MRNINKTSRLYFIFCYKNFKQSDMIDIIFDQFM